MFVSKIGNFSPRLMPASYSKNINFKGAYATLERPMGDTFCGRVADSSAPVLNTPDYYTITRLENAIDRMLICATDYCERTDEELRKRGITRVIHDTVVPNDGIYYLDIYKEKGDGYSEYYKVAARDGKPVKSTRGEYHGIDLGYMQLIQKDGGDREYSILVQSPKKDFSRVGMDGKIIRIAAKSDYVLIDIDSDNGVFYLIKNYRNIADKTQPESDMLRDADEIYLLKHTTATPIKKGSEEYNKALNMAPTYYDLVAR